MHAPRLLNVVLLLVTGVSAQTPSLRTAGPASPQAALPCSVSGKVVNAQALAAENATVTLHASGDASRSATTDAAGNFAFEGLPCGPSVFTAQKSGLIGSLSVVTLAGAPDQRLQIVLHPEPSSSAYGGSPRATQQTIDFSDKPDFAIAGVTDWTAVGGHGSDAVLRTSEDLSRATVRLNAESTSQPNPHPAPDLREATLRSALAAAPHGYAANHDLGELYLHSARFAQAVPLLKTAAALPQSVAEDQYDLALACRALGDPVEAQRHLQQALARKDSAAFHSLAGQIEEDRGDPLAAVKELQRAAQLDPSEQTYLAWGAELLVHRAIWQAVEVFRNGATLHPASARLQAAWGAALFAGARYDDAAHQLCEASVLDSDNPEPYRFLGKIALATAAPLPCALQALERFAQQRPASAESQYFYAMVLLKQGSPSGRDRAQTLLQKATALDPKYAPAYLELGILAADRKEYPEAIRNFEKAIVADPSQAEAHFRLGVAYDRTGDPIRARQHYQLHDQLDAEEAATVEQGRRHVKQFEVVLDGSPPDPRTQP